MEKDYLKTRFEPEEFEKLKKRNLSDMSVL